MPFITQGKTNWKFLLAVAILATVASEGILIYSSKINQELASLSQIPEIKIPEKTKNKTIQEENFKNPEEIVQILYNWYLNDFSFNYEEIRSRAELKWAESRHNYYDVQDQFLCNLYNVGFAKQSRVVAVNINRDSATVNIELSYCWGKDNIPIELILIDGSWKISDVRCDQIITNKNIAEDDTNIKINQSTPEEVVQSFYNWYYADSSLTQTKYDNCAYRKRPELTDYFKEKLDNFVNYDQIACTQDEAPLVGFGEAQINGSNAIVRVEQLSLTNSKPRFIPIELVLINGQWKINNILCNEIEPHEEPKG